MISYTSISSPRELNFVLVDYLELCAESFLDFIMFVISTSIMK